MNKRGCCLKVGILSLTLSASLFCKTLFAQAITQGTSAFGTSLASKIISTPSTNIPTKPLTSNLNDTSTSGKTVPAISPTTAGVKGPIQTSDVKGPTQTSGVKSSSTTPENPAASRNDLSFEALKTMLRQMVPNKALLEQCNSDSSCLNLVKKFDAMPATYRWVFVLNPKALAIGAVDPTILPSEVSSIIQSEHSALPSFGPTGVSQPSISTSDQGPTVNGLSSVDVARQIILGHQLISSASRVIATSSTSSNPAALAGTPRSIYHADGEGEGSTGGSDGNSQQPEKSAEVDPNQRDYDVMGDKEFIDNVLDSFLAQDLTAAYAQGDKATAQDALAILLQGPTFKDQDPNQIQAQVSPSQIAFMQGVWVAGGRLHLNLIPLDRGGGGRPTDYQSSENPDQVTNGAPLSAKQIQTGALIEMGKIYYVQPVSSRTGGGSGMDDAGGQTNSSQSFQRDGAGAISGLLNTCDRPGSTCR